MTTKTDPISAIDLAAATVKYTGEVQTGRTRSIAEQLGQTAPWA